MIYIETSSEDVYYNFGVEYYFTTEKELDDSVLLFWRTQPTVMIGKYQNTLEEINRKYIEENSIQIVRRMSGGGAIFTDLGGYQFTFIDYNDGENIEFHEYINPVVDALRALEIPAEFSGRNDLLIKGKKFSGNAQFKINGNTVHHGSTLFDTNIEMMVKSTRPDIEKIESKSIKSVRERVTNIAEHLKRPMTGEEYKAHMIKYLMGDSDRIYKITKEDNKRIKEIADKLFRSEEAIFGRDPKSSYRATARLKGGRFTAGLELKSGRITDIKFTGDFFGNEKVGEIEKALVNIKFNEKDVLEKIKSFGQNIIYGISPEEMVNIIFAVEK